MRTDVLFLLVFGATIPGLYSETLLDQTLSIQQTEINKLQAAERGVYPPGIELQNSIKIHKNKTPKSLGMRPKPSGKFMIHKFQ